MNLHVIEQLTKSELYYYFSNSLDEKQTIEKVMQKYPVKLTPFLEKLMQHSEAVRLQYLPHVLEMKSYGTATPFEEGKDASKVYGLERLYRDRVLITPHFDCPAYCRFCYKKSRVMRNKPGMTLEDIDKAVEEIAKMKEVRGALITGGDPLMAPDKLFYLLDKLTLTDNIREIRVGTRTLLTMPNIFTNELCQKLASYTQPNYNNPHKSQYLAINVHFNHPDELVPEVLEACYKLTSCGITLRNQTVLLKGINDSIDIMANLFQLLIRNNIIPYYMNHCMPVEGSDYLRTSVQKGLDIYRHLNTESSCTIPHYVYAPSGGKVHVGPDSVFKYENINGLRMIKTKMLYDASEFYRITGKKLPPMHTVTEDGKIEGYYIDGSDN